MFPIIPADRAAAEWRNESTQKPPKQAVYVHESNAADILKNAYAHTATVWTGDFHNAKQVLAAMKKRVRRSSEKTKNAPADIQTTFHTHRMKQAQQSRVLNMLAVEIGAGFQLSNPRPMSAQPLPMCTPSRTTRRFCCRSISFWVLSAHTNGTKKA